MESKWDYRVVDTDNGYELYALDEHHAAQVAENFKAEGRSPRIERREVVRGDWVEFTGGGDD